jgi:hypothetical protein
MPLRFIDEFDHGFGWTIDGDRIPRTSHAVRSDDRVWLIDVIDGASLDERVAALGHPAGVVQLLDRHNRDCAAVAERLGVPLHVTPFEPVEGAPFAAFPILKNRLWREVALWFAAERTLVLADALGSLDYFRAGGEPFGVNPALRLFPPRRSLAGLEPEHILFGHGEAFHGPQAADALRTALTTARKRLPAAWLATARSVVRR